VRLPEFRETSERKVDSCSVEHLALTPQPLLPGDNLKHQGLDPQPQGGPHLPRGDLPQATGNLPHPGPVRNPRVGSTSLYFI
jgi:hypothetical protein